MFADQQIRVRFAGKDTDFGSRNKGRATFGKTVVN